ncbi:hypothetical protein V1264_017231 [Littorina saxatilis]|uniref:Uncharacterized protein n=1 Tax=Littorina saxatilis TaxID=31220 RepID=A0AAN9BM86_9CAEN
MASPLVCFAFNFKEFPKHLLRFQYASDLLRLEASVDKDLCKCLTAQLDKMQLAWVSVPERNARELSETTGERQEDLRVSMAYRRLRRQDKEKKRYLNVADANREMTESRQSYGGLLGSEQETFLPLVIMSRV